jgi:hypothetical protein
LIQDDYSAKRDVMQMSQPSKNAEKKNALMYVFERRLEKMELRKGNGASTSQDLLKTKKDVSTLAIQAALIERLN